MTSFVVIEQYYPISRTKGGLKFIPCNKKKRKALKKGEENLEDESSQGEGSEPSKTEKKPKKTKKASKKKGKNSEDKSPQEERKNPNKKNNNIHKKIKKDSEQEDELQLDISDNDIPDVEDKKKEETTETDKELNQNPPSEQENSQSDESFVVNSDESNGPENPQDDQMDDESRKGLEEFKNLQRINRKPLKEITSPEVSSILDIKSRIARGNGDSYIVNTVNSFILGCPFISFTLLICRNPEDEEYKLVEIQKADYRIQKNDLTIKSSMKILTNTEFFGGAKEVRSIIIEKLFKDIYHLNSLKNEVKISNDILKKTEDKRIKSIYQLAFFTKQELTKIILWSNVFYLGKEVNIKTLPEIQELSIDSLLKNKKMFFEHEPSLVYMQHVIKPDELKDLYFSGFTYLKLLNETKKGVESITEPEKDEWTKGSISLLKEIKGISLIERKDGKKQIFLKKTISCLEGLREILKGRVSLIEAFNDNTPGLAKQINNISKTGVVLVNQIHRLHWYQKKGIFATTTLKNQKNKKDIFVDRSYKFSYEKLLEELSYLNKEDVFSIYLIGTRYISTNQNIYQDFLCLQATDKNIHLYDHVETSKIDLDKLGIKIISSVDEAPIGSETNTNVFFKNMKIKTQLESEISRIPNPKIHTIFTATQEKEFQIRAQNVIMSEGMNLSDLLLCLSFVVCEGKYNNLIISNNPGDTKNKFSRNLNDQVDETPKFTPFCYQFQKRY